MLSCIHRRTQHQHCGTFRTPTLMLQVKRKLHTPARQLQHDLKAAQVVSQRFVYPAEGSLELVLEVSLSAQGKLPVARTSRFEPLPVPLIEALEHVANSDYPEASRGLARALLLFEAGVRGSEAAKTLKQDEAWLWMRRERFIRGGLLYLLRFRHRKRRGRVHGAAATVNQGDG